MTYTDKETRISFGIHDLRAVADERRFIVLGKSILEALKSRFDADFAALIECDSTVTSDVSGLKTLFKKGSIPNDFDAQVTRIFLSNEGSSKGADSTRERIQSNHGYLFKVLAVSDTAEVCFLIGNSGGSPFEIENRVDFEASIERVFAEISDAYIISQQANKIEVLMNQLEKVEGHLVGSDSNSDSEVTLSELDSRVESISGVKTYSEKMKTVLNQIAKVGPSSLSLLLKGETGTGKSYIARKIHEHNATETSSFEMVSCGSLTPSLVEGEIFGWRKGAFSGAEEDRQGLFERAHGGTVFLDEVSELPMEVQQKLLRVIQEGVVRPVGSSELIPVDCRLIASSCRDLSEAVRQGEFREDLYYRLAGFQLEIPSLRERSEDIKLIIAEFLQELRVEHGFSKQFSESAALELKSYSWPGNIQQLKNVVQQSYLISEKRMIARKVLHSVLNDSPADALVGEKFEVSPEEITIRIPRIGGFNEIISEVERAVILAALRQNRGNKSRVTKQLKIPRQTLYNKLERFGFTDEELRS